MQVCPSGAPVMADEQVVKQLVERLSSEDAAVQESTAEQMKYAMLRLRVTHSYIPFQR